MGCPQIEQLLLECLQTARGEANIAQRLSDYQKIEQTIMADAPWVPLYHQTRALFWGKTVGGVYYHPVWVYTFETFYHT